jgi:hypothetical protein
MEIHKVYRFFFKYFRVRRMSVFEKYFSIKDYTTAILDVGGDKYNWQFIKSKPFITIGNITKPSDWIDDKQFRFDFGDATHPSVWR